MVNSLDSIWPLAVSFFPQALRDGDRLQALDVVVLVQISLVILYFNFAPTVFHTCTWLSFVPKSEGKGFAQLFLHHLKGR